jgi:hypothetical protein
MQPNRTRLSLLAFAINACLPMLAVASPSSNSAYRTDAQNTRVQDATSKGVAQVNMIACIMSAMRPDALVNQGDYLALVDQGKCNSDQQSSSSNAGGNDNGADTPSYMTATVNATRASNADPMRVKIWLDDGEGGGDGSRSIYVNLSASQAPSDSNPYGLFRLDYCGLAGEHCQMNGFLDANAEGISYFETEQRDDNGTPSTSTKALRLTLAGANSGAGALNMQEGDGAAAFRFAYNADHFLRNDGSQDQCFTRDASDPATGQSVWRYGLYDAGSGARIERNSGFPIEYTGANGVLYRGQIGYWGLSLPAGATSQVANGDSVTRIDYGGGQATRTSYAIVKSAGRLTKYSKHTRTLAQTAKIRFNAWIGDASGQLEGALPPRNYEMYWDNQAAAFMVTGSMECNNQGCQTRDLEHELAVPAAFFAPQGGVRGWSASLGGELFIPWASTEVPNPELVNVIYRQSELVYPADMPSSLYCLRDCPTAASLAGYFSNQGPTESPYAAGTFNNWQARAAADVVQYSLNTVHATLNDATQAPVVLDNVEGLQQRPQYAGGVRTGRLFTTLADARCNNEADRYCDYRVESLDTFYQWETGPNQWNQFAAVKDGNGQIVQFDAPLQVNYTVPSDDARYGAYAGKSIVLQYGGFGQLWGIPGACVSPTTNERVSCDTAASRYVPSFVIPFDETLGVVYHGSTPLLAKWMDREIRFARKDNAVCTAEGLVIPGNLTLPTAASLRNPADPSASIYIGTQPVVTAAPRVVQGDVKY